MKVIRETIGDTTILIQAFDEDLEVVGGKQKGRSTQLTGVGDEIQAIYSKVRSMIKTIAEDIGTELKELQASTRPKEVELEFTLGISAQAGPVWVLAGSGEYTLKVKMTWEFNKDE